MAIATRILGKYRLIALLAQGGMGDVWLALQRGPAGFSKLVVIKELRTSFLNDGAFLRMFLEEARISARLNHPNVVQTYEAFRHDGAYFIAMEYVDGQCLQRLRHRAYERGEALPLSLELPVVVAMLRALEYAHDFRDYGGAPLSVVHRDVSPHNVIVTYDGQVKLLDFGIAKALDSTEETRAGTVKGKVAYMSPEQALSDHVDHRTDLFSIGVLLAEAIMGQRFWPRLSEARMFTRLADGDLPSLRERARPAPLELLLVCERALAIDRDARYATAAAMRADIEAAISRYPDVCCDANATGAFASTVFATERAAVRTCVDAHVRALRETDAEADDAYEVSGDLVSLAALHAGSASGPRMPSSDSGSHSSSHPGSPSSLSPVAATMGASAQSSALRPVDAPVGEASAVAAFRPAIRRFGGAAIVAISIAVGLVLYLARSRADVVPAATASWPSTAAAPELRPPATLDVAPSPTPPPSADPTRPGASERPARPRPPPAPALAPQPAKRTDLDIRLSR